MKIAFESTPVDLLTLSDRDPKLQNQKSRKVLNNVQYKTLKYEGFLKLVYDRLTEPYMQRSFTVYCIRACIKYDDKVAISHK